MTASAPTRRRLGDPHDFLNSDDNTGHSVAIDGCPSPSRVYAGTGNRNATDNAGGQVLAFDAGTTSFEQKIAYGTSDRPIGLAVNHVPSCSSKATLIVAAEHHGVMVGSEQGSTFHFTSATSTPLSGDHAMMSGDFKTFPHLSIDWPAGNSIAFLHDVQQGVWRTTDAGASWEEIVKAPSTNELGGFVATDPTGATLYYSMLGASGGDVYELANAGSCHAPCTPTKISPAGAFHPGPIGVDADGNLWVVEVSVAGSDARIRRRSAGEWETAADTYFPGVAPFAQAIAFGPLPDRHVYVGTNRNAFIVGTY